MKRILFLLLCAAVGLVSLQAQVRYRVYAHTGKVEYKPKAADAKWQTVQDGMEMAILDTLRLSKGAMVRIEHVERHMIYNSLHAGTMSVYGLIREAKNENARRVTKRLNTELASGNSKPIDQYAMNVLGGGARGMIQSRDSLERLADMFAWIGAQACSGAQSPTIEGITFTKKKVWGEWDFQYENHTDKDYFMNVLHINKLTGAVSLCYVVTPEVEEVTVCPIVPGGYCQCGTEVFFPDSPNDIYVLVATELMFDAYVLDNELAYHPIDKAKKADFDIQYMW